MKIKLIWAILPFLALTACASAVAQSPNQTTVPTLLATIPPAGQTEQPGGIVSPGPTGLFITQVMATKYAMRTEYAAYPTQTPTPTIAPGSPDCLPADLETAFNANGATGRIDLEVAVTNVSGSACFLPSWPQVELLDHSGKKLDIIYDYVYFNANPSTLPPTQESNPGKPLIYGMEAGQTAGLALLWGNWCAGPVIGGVIIRIYLLGTSGWMDIPADIGGGGYCDDPGGPSTIDVIGFGY